MNDDMHFNNADYGSPHSTVFLEDLGAWLKWLASNRRRALLARKGIRKLVTGKLKWFPKEVRRIWEIVSRGIEKD